MRIAINLPDALVDRGKQQANRENLTLSQLIERSLRATLRPTPKGEGLPFRLVTFGRGGMRPGFSFERPKDVLDTEDTERVTR